MCDGAGGLRLRGGPAGGAYGRGFDGPQLPEGGALALRSGRTGTDYSPLEEPYDYYGGPMHRAFWQQVAAGAGPATALFNAKIQYLAEMPHRRTTALDRAIGMKILRQYTCLGLGW